MNASIQTKLLLMCILLVLVTTAGISATYYVLTKQDKHRESLQRIQIAFEIIFDDYTTRLASYTEKFESFVGRETKLPWLAYVYGQNPKKLKEPRFILFNLALATEELREFGASISATRVAFYGADNRLLMVYHQQGDQDTVGAYVISETDQDTYLPIEDVNALTDSLIQDKQPIADLPLPEGIAAAYAGDIPETLAAGLFSEGQQIGFRIVAPLAYKEDHVGVLVGDVFYPQRAVDRYASLSKTAVNFFAGTQWSLGTLPVQSELDRSVMEQSRACEDLLRNPQGIEVSSVTFEEQAYYQGHCVFKDVQGIVGGITVNLSQEIEKQEIRKILTSVLVIAVIVSGLAFGFTVVSTRKPVRFIQQLIRYIDRLSKGDIPEKITDEYKGEFNTIKTNLNTLIEATQETTRITEEIADGNLTVEARERSEHDRLMQALNRMIQRLNAMLQETDGLIQAVQGGNLTRRGNAEAFAGGWQNLVIGMNSMVDAFVAPIDRTAQVLDQIANGEIPEPITEQYKGDFNDIKTNLNLLIEVTQEITQLAEAIADGNLNVEVRKRSEHDRLMNALTVMIQRLNAIMSEMDTLTQAVQHGNLTVRGDAEAFAGGWHDLVVGVNNVVEAFVTPITVTSVYLDRISKGDLPDLITKTYHGDFNTIKNNLNTLIEATQETTRITEEIASGNLTVEAKERSEQDRLMQALNRMIHRLNAILQETDGLIQAVQDGKLDVRGDAETFEGGWRDLIVGVNSLIDAFVGPIMMTAMAINQVTKGDIPHAITAEYNGDFNEIKTNLNTLIETMRGLLDETNDLIQAVQDGRLDVRGNTERFVGDWRKLVVGMNNVIDAFVRPISMAAKQIDRIARGDIPEPITEEYQGDFNAIKQNLNVLIEAMNAITQLAEAMASGNLTVEVTERSEQDTLMQALNTMITKLSEVVMQVKNATDNVAAGSQTMRSNSEEMSQGAAHQASAAEEASSSMEQMAANIRQNADNARQTEQIAAQSAAHAREGGQAVAETVTAMREIVQKIVIIQEIADQTRMLSLNATIEAARAEEHGKAFSVVAAEVRKLSDITKKAATEINTLATSSVLIAERSGELLAKLVPSIEKTAELVQEIRAASSEQSSGTEQINRAIQQLDQVTQQNVLASDDMAAAAEELAAQADQLRGTMRFFQIAETGRPSRHEENKVRESRAQEPATAPDAEEDHSSERAEQETEKTKTDDTPPGSIRKLGQDDVEGDERDADFERY